MMPLSYYYTEEGRPFYPDMKMEEPWLLEFDAGEVCAFITSMIG
jgi:hypothetical protein